MRFKKHRHAQRAAEEPQVEPIVPVDGFLRRAADCELLIEPRKKDELHLETELGIGKIFVEFDDHFEAAEALKVGSLPRATLKCTRMVSGVRLNRL